MSKFGRYQVAEPPSKIRCLHFHDGTPLRPVDYSPKCAILDQEDLDKQGIDVSSFIPAASKGVTALGSCTANTFIEWGAAVLPIQAFARLIGQLLSAADLTLPKYAQLEEIYRDVKTLEIAAIIFYFRCTHQTGAPAQEWPPTDCGSTGLYVYDLAKRLGFAAKENIAHGAENIVSLLQGGPLLGGIPYLNAWMRPTAEWDYCIDKDGSTAALREQISLGIAGGHELLFCKITHLELTADGKVDPAGTIIEFPNHWDDEWGDRGRARIHLSTLAAFGTHADFRRFTPTPTIS